MYFEYDEKELGIPFKGTPTTRYYYKTTVLSSPAGDRAMWYGISPGEAYLRFCHGNIDGLVDEDDDYDM